MQNAKMSLKNVRSGQESNLGLQIQSQLCLPLDQGFEKNAWKPQKFQIGFVEI